MTASSIIWPMMLFLSSLFGSTDKEKAEFFVEASCQPDTVVVGHKAVLTYILYSSLPVVSVEQSPENLEIKDAKVVLTYRSNGENLSTATKNGRRYYALVWKQYAILPQKTGTLEIPTATFKVKMRGQKQSSDPFDNLWGNMEYYTIEAKGKTKKIKLEAIDKPKRTTQDMLRSGSGII